MVLSSTGTTTGTTSVTTDYINNELVLAEKELQIKEQQLIDLDTKKKNQNNDHDSNDTYDYNQSILSVPVLIQRLQQLDERTIQLTLLQKLIKWIQDYPMSNDDTDEIDIDNDYQYFFQYIQRLQRLGTILLQSISSTTTSTSIGSAINSNIFKPLSSQSQSLSEFFEFVQTLYNDEYILNFYYIQQKIICNIRHLLQQCKYPSIDGCNQLLQEFDYTNTTTSTNPNTNNNKDDDGYYTLIVQHCSYYQQIIEMHRTVSTTITSFLPISLSSSSSSSIISSYDSNHLLVIEFCRPFVERMKYHFVNPYKITHTNNNNNKETKNQQQQKSSTIHQKIDRLLETIFNYVKDTILNTVVLDVVCTTNISFYIQPTKFINEILCIIQWILINECNYFRHPIIAGTESNSTILLTSIEHILQFDSYIQNLILSIVENNTNDDDNEITVNSTNSSPSRSNLPTVQVVQQQQQQQQQLNTNVIRLFDVCIAGDEELFHWWLQQECTNIISMLVSSSNTDEYSINNTDIVDRELTNTTSSIISYQSELFVSLLRSVLLKANAFQFSGPYLHDVVAPLCMKYIDMIHTHAVSVTKTLTKRNERSTSSSISNSTAIISSTILKYIQSTIELISATNIASSILLGKNNTSTQYQINSRFIRSNNNNNCIDDDDNTTNNDNDLYRVGQSFDNLQHVLIDDCVKTVIDIILMDRCKLASYLMRCSHLLSIIVTPSTNTNQDTLPTEASFDLHPTIQSLHTILYTLIQIDTNEQIQQQQREQAQHVAEDTTSINTTTTITNTLYNRIITEVSQSLLEVALNVDGMTPDIGVYGASTFYTDVHATFDTFVSLHDNNNNNSSNYISLTNDTVLRLYDIVHVMKMETKQLRSICQLLSSLVDEESTTVLLHDEMFQHDDRLYEEAVSMIRAKNLLYIQLSDVISIVNRRSLF